jgi:hypothetical protein
VSRREADTREPAPYPRERWHWYLEGQLRFDNDARLGDAVRNICAAGVSLGSPDPDVIIADRVTNPED